MATQYTATNSQLPSADVSGAPREVWASNMQSELRTQLVGTRICNTMYQDALMGARKIRIGIVPRRPTSELIPGGSRRLSNTYDRNVRTDRRDVDVSLIDTQDSEAPDSSTTFARLGTKVTSQDDRQFTYPQETLSYYDFDVQQTYKDSWRVEKWDGIQTNFEFMMEFTSEKAYDFARVLDTFLLHDYTDNVGKQLTAGTTARGTNEIRERTFGKDGATDTSTALDSNGNMTEAALKSATNLPAAKAKVKNEFFDALIPAIQQLENDNIPREAIWAVVPFEITTALWKDERFQRDTDRSDARNVSGSHRFGTFEGINIYRSQLLKDVTVNTNKKGKFIPMGYRGSYTCVIQDPMDFEIFERLEGYNALGIRAQMLWDGAMLRPETTCRVLVDVESTS